ncbi:hypothetical protein NPIL_455501 [Nephila pilipes]|uniref:Uncharacterized protein n=1 Tax=Nephila pilipes TaxID=299642 RepID=A0A8X6IE85_NEPPI|nr:hypothetical protein NPIL_455501 [Nephila pilipes]
MRKRRQLAAIQVKVEGGGKEKKLFVRYLLVNGATEQQLTSFRNTVRNTPHWHSIVLTTTRTMPHIGMVWTFVDRYRRVEFTQLLSFTLLSLLNNTASCKETHRARGRCCFCPHVRIRLPIKACRVEGLLQV